MHAPLLVFLYTDLHGTLAETRKIPHQPAGVIWPIVGAAHVDNISFVTADGFVDNDDDLTPAKACTTHLGSSITKHPSIMSPSKTTGFFFSILQGVMEPLLDEEEQDELDAMRPSLHDMEDDYAILAMRDGYAWIGSETHDFSPPSICSFLPPTGLTRKALATCKPPPAGSMRTPFTALQSVSWWRFWTCTKAPARTTSSARACASWRISAATMPPCNATTRRWALSSWCRWTKSRGATRPPRIYER